MLFALGMSACLLACLAVFDPSIFDRSTPTGVRADRARFEAARAFATRPLAAQAVAGKTSAALARASGADGALVRLNQVGFPSGAPKTATAMARAPLRRRTFRVLDSRGHTVLTGVAGTDRGAWNRRWRHTYPLDFSALSAGGVYTIALTGAGREIRSPPFSVGISDYQTLAAREVSFLRAQRDGPEVDRSLLDRMPSHLEDAHALVYGTPSYANDVLRGTLTPLGGPPVNVAGGWADSGDYLKFVETASFVEDLLLYTIREHSTALGGAAPALVAEARYGLRWLGSMWDQRTGVLRYQVGIGNGNRLIEGDHDVGWRLPQHDDTLRARPGRGAYYVRYRPVFQTGTGGAPISPNLAGRLAAAFGLCAQVFGATDPAYAHQCLLWGQTIFARADTRPRSLVTTTPFDYYPEREWQGNMELGAAELLRATATTAERSGLPHAEALYWFEQADQWGQAYMEGPLDGTDTFNLYDVAPLGHLELMEGRRFAPAPAVARMRSDQTAVLTDLRDQLSASKRVAARDPLGIGYKYADDDTVSHLLGLSLQARFYDRIAGTRALEGYAQRQLDAVLGQNAWGVSFVVGAGGRFPVCLHHQVANLSGSLNGRHPLLLGAVVPGPVNAREVRGGSAAEGYRRCPARAVGDPYAQFSGRGAAYKDNVLSVATNEPSDDLAALALLAFATETSG